MKQLAFALILLLLLPSCIHENPSSPQTPEPASSQVAAPSSSLPSSASSSASSSSFTGPYAADPGPDDPRSLVDQETLQWVWTFLQYFYATPFEDPSEIPARDVYWFAFTRIARDAWDADSQQVMADLEKNNQAFPIPREVAEEMIAKTFGLEDLPYEGDVAYNPDQDVYRYYFAHGEPDVSIHFLDFQELGDSVYTCSAEASPQWESPETHSLSFTFRIVEDGGETYCQALSLSAQP